LSVLLSVVFLDNLGYAIVFPYLFFYASSLGASAFVYGLPFLALLVLVGALVAVGFGILITTLSTLISVNAPKEAQGGSLGIAQSLAALAQTVGPTVAASFFAFGSSIGMVGLAFIVSAGITLCTIPLILDFKKHKALGKVEN
jgi:MFS family permease